MDAGAQDLVLQDLGRDGVWVLSSYTFKPQNIKGLGIFMVASGLAPK